MCVCVCATQSSWVISVELAIGPEEGISYLTDKGSTVSIILTFTNIYTLFKKTIKSSIYLMYIFLGFIWTIKASS